jgi:hypothetical protein
MNSWCPYILTIFPIIIYQTVGIASDHRRVTGSHVPGTEGDPAVTKSAPCSVKRCLPRRPLRQIVSLRHRPVSLRPARSRLPQQSLPQPPARLPPIRSESSPQRLRIKVGQGGSRPYRSARRRAAPDMAADLSSFFCPAGAGAAARAWLRLPKRPMPPCCWRPIQAAPRSIREIRTPEYLPERQRGKLRLKVLGPIGR